MAENITTLIDIRNRQKKFVISAEDLLYLVHGSELTSSDYSSYSSSIMTVAFK